MTDNQVRKRGRGRPVFSRFVDSPEGLRNRLKPIGFYDPDVRFDVAGSHLPPCREFSFLDRFRISFVRYSQFYFGDFQKAADSLGVTWRHFKRYLKGELGVPASKLRALSRVAALPEEWILVGSSGEIVSENGSATGLTSDDFVEADQRVDEVRSDVTADDRNFGVRDRKSEVAGRIKESITAAGGATAVKERSGLALGTINNAQSGTNLPGTETLIKLAAATGRSIDWLLTGAELGGLPTVSVSASEFVLVPVLPEAVSAGSPAATEGNDLDVEKHVAFRGEWMRQVGVNPKRAHVLRVKGDSMEPTLSDGDVILVDTSDTDPAGGGMFVIGTIDGAQVKRLMRRTDGSLLIISDNREIYPPEVLARADADAFRIIGRVRWYARTVR